MSVRAVEKTSGWELEERLWEQGYAPVAGVDEAGRGALAGPVVAAAVILPAGGPRFYDSKCLSPAQREQGEREIIECALAWGVGVAWLAEIEECNILGATHLAARRALRRLRQQVVPGALLTDYLRLDEPEPVFPVARADSLSTQAAAAGILAKVTRDRLMREMARCYPAYGFDSNKGYGSPAHLAALAEHGPSPLHRRTFAPVLRTIEASK